LIRFSAYMDEQCSMTVTSFNEGRPSAGIFDMEPSLSHLPN
jgi:hypothetical protein